MCSQQLGADTRHALSALLSPTTYSCSMHVIRVEKAFLTSREKAASSRTEQQVVIIPSPPLFVHTIKATGLPGLVSVMNSRSKMLFSRLFFCFRRMAPPDMKYQAAMTPSRNTTVCGIRRRVLLVLRVPLLSCACHGFRCQCAASILVSTCGKSLTPVHASERRLEHSADAQCIYPDAGLHTAARMGPSTAGHEDLFWWTRLRGFAAHDFVSF